MSENNSKLKVKLINLKKPQQGDKELYLYKIIPYKYLLQWIYAEKVRFDQIAKWDDVYELFLFKQKYIQNGNPINFEAESQSIYAQSWSLVRDSEAMWRIYSPDKLSVRIKTSYNNLVGLLESSDIFSKGLGAYLGKIKYMKPKNIDEKIHEYSKNIFSEENIVDSLCIKRESFSHEKECRIILWKQTVEMTNGCNAQTEISPYINLAIRPLDLIQEIAFDSRLDDNLFSCLKSALHVLLPGIRIQKSTLGIIKPKTYTI